MYVADNSPSAESNYHARFKFDPNSVTISSGAVHDIFVGTNAAGTVSLRLQITRSSRLYQLRTASLLDSGSIRYSSWVSLSDAPHSLEIAWQAATTGSNGSHLLYIDGAPASSVTGLANSSSRVDTVRFGPQALPSGVSGVEYFDGFASTRTGYIGPLSGPVAVNASATSRVPTPIHVAIVGPNRTLRY
jgi:hypothetical protein